MVAALAQAEAPAGEVGEAGCPVPLPAKGPQAAPGWVRAAVAAAPWRGGLEPAGERDVELTAAEVVGEIPADLVGQVRAAPAPPPRGRVPVFLADRLTPARRRRPSGAAPGGCGSGPTGTRTGSTGTA